MKVDSENISLTDGGVEILRWDIETKQFDKIGYVTPEVMENLKTRVMLTPNFTWTGDIIIDIRMFELGPGRLVGEIMLRVGIAGIKCKTIMLSVRLTKQMLQGKYPYVKTEATIKGFG